MSVPAGEGAVVPAIPLGQAHTVAACAVAVAAFVVVLVKAPDRFVTALVAVATAALFAAVALVSHRRGSGPAAPLRVGRDELPPVTAVWKVLIQTAWFYPLFYAGMVWLALSQPHQHTPVGIAFALPVVLWFQVRRSARAARDSGETLWVGAGPAWRLNRVRYLTPDRTPAGQAGVTADGRSG
jgi:hypothetical protein